VRVSLDGGSTWSNRGLPVNEIDLTYTAVGWGLHSIDLHSLVGQSSVMLYLQFYPLTAWNATNSGDTLNLTTSGGSWTSFLDPTTLNLEPATAGNTTPSVYVPWTAVAWSSDTFTALATGSGGRSDTAMVKTTAAGASLYNDFADVPFGRRTRDHSVVYHNGKLYKFGGWDYTNARNYVDIYDIATDTWSWLPYMPNLFYAVEADGDGNEIWLVSGRISEGS
jgi:hypothetical protein